ncbi:MAG: hypothetical protein ACO1RX_15030 [Candidatus Sericytochromatia bacterium]
MEFLASPLHWGHPLAWLVYIWSAGNLILALALWWGRETILLPQADLLRADAHVIYAEITGVQAQLKAVNRQADRGLDQLEQLMNLIQGLFLSLLETRLVGLALRKLRHKPLVVRMVTTKGINVVLGQLETVVRTRHIEDRDETLNET